MSHRRKGKPNKPTAPAGVVGNQLLGEPESQAGRDAVGDQDHEPPEDVEKHDPIVHHGVERHATLSGRYQKRPLICPPSSMSMLKAAGSSPRPGMRMMSPAITTRKPAPAEGRIPRTSSVQPVGAPRTRSSSLRLSWVFAMQMGSPSRPACFSRSRSSSAAASYFTLPAP